MPGVLVVGVGADDGLDRGLVGHPGVKVWAAAVEDLHQALVERLCRLLLSFMLLLLLLLLYYR